MITLRMYIEKNHGDRGIASFARMINKHRQVVSRWVNDGARISDRGRIESGGGRLLFELNNKESK
jgi:hypothetical protein